MRAFVWTRMLCATVENNVDSCNGERGCENFPHSRAHIHFWTTKLYRFLVLAGDSGTEAITFLHVMNFFIICKIQQRKDWAGGEEKILARFSKFIQLLNKTLFITRTKPEMKSFSWLTFSRFFFLQRLSRRRCSAQRMLASWHNLVRERWVRLSNSIGIYTHRRSGHQRVHKARDWNLEDKKKSMSNG